MSHYIYIRHEGFWAANKQFPELFEAVQRAALATANPQRASGLTERFARLIDVDLEKEISVLEERKFWSRCFFDAARIFANGEWRAMLAGVPPATAVYWNYWTGLALAALVREQEPGWASDDLDSRERRARESGLCTECGTAGRGASFSVGHLRTELSREQQERLLQDLGALGAASIRFEAERKLAFLLPPRCVGQLHVQLQDAIPTLPERKFWTRCLFDLATLYASGEVVNPDGTGSPARWIYWAERLARALHAWVKEADRAWVCDARGDFGSTLTLEELEDNLMKHQSVSA